MERKRKRVNWMKNIDGKETYLESNEGNSRVEERRGKTRKGGQCRSAD